MADIFVFSEAGGGFKEEIGRASTIRLSSSGVSVPIIDYEGIYVEARGQGGPLHVTFGDFKTPAPPPIVPAMPAIPLPSTNQRVKDLEALVICLVHMMGDAVMIHDHEFNKAVLGLSMTAHYDDLRRMTITVEEKK